MLAFLIIYAGLDALEYYSVPLVSTALPKFLPHVLIATGLAMILLAFLGFHAAK